MYKIKKTGQRFYFEIVAPNGRTLAKSTKDYTTLQDCEKTIAACAKSDRIAYDFPVKVTMHGSTKKI